MVLIPYSRITKVTFSLFPMCKKYVNFMSEHLCNKWYDYNFIFRNCFPDNLVEACYQKVTFEPQHDKTNKMTFAPSEDSDQPRHPPSLTDRSLRCALNGYLRTHFFFIRITKSLIGLGGCQCWSESLLGEQSFCWFWHAVAQIYL